ncbi:MAG: zinc finger domain-containing protein [Candidatus Hodarchaeales archaeon]|jgi:RecJ-like exonuclease
MSSRKCPQCKGKGITSVKKTTKCPKCHGMGSTKMVIGGGKPTAKDVCPKCEGKGKIVTTDEKPCSSCSGTGFYEKKCPFCGKILTQDSKEICEVCEKEKSIFQLISPVSKQMLEFKKIYLAKVVNIVDFGYFVQLAPRIEGLIRNKKFSGKVDDQILVKLINKKGDKLEFEHVVVSDYSHLPLKRIHDSLPLQKIKEKREIGTFISFLAQVQNIRQIAKGPKIYTLLDESGLIEAAAFRLDFLEDVSIGDIVEVAGQYTVHRGTEQIEISNLFKVDQAYSNAFNKRMEKYLDTRSEPPIIRHHGDCDGIIAGISLELSLRHLWVEMFEQVDEDKIRHLIKRTVNKPPFYDPIDSVRDVNFALEDLNRFGDKLPLVIMLDTGSSEESLFSYKLLSTYDIEALVVDHHFPSTIIQEIVGNHLNVYHAGGDYNICAGMLGVELARRVNPEVTDEIVHLPAIAGFGDRVEGIELDQYLDLAKKKNYSESYLTDIAIAVDYQAYFLKFSPGRLLLSDLLGITGNAEKQLSFVKLLATEARGLLQKQLSISLEYSQEEILPNGVRLAILDVEKYASRFDWPPPGKITGSLFDHLGKSNQTPLVTIGLGPDFAIFRSKKVKLDFPKLVKTLADKLPHANIEGGGHEIVGSLKFISGVREEFLELIQELLTMITVIQKEG